MASEKRNLDSNQIVDTSPHFLADMISLVKKMLQDCEFIKGTRCTSIRSYKQLKTGLQKLLNLLYQASTLDSPPAVKRYLVHLESLQAEFTVMDDGAASRLSAEVTRILELLRTFVVSRKEVMKPEVAQPTLLNTSDEKNYKQFYNCDHAPIPPYVLFAYPVGDRRGDKADKNGKVTRYSSFGVSLILCVFVE